MDYPVQLLVILIAGIIVVLIVVGIAYSLSGQSTDLVTWLVNSIKGATNIDFSKIGKK